MTRCSRAARGLTLLEMLVTLVIVSMLAGVVGQALLQLARIERLLEGGQLGAMADSVRAEWVRSALVSLLPGDAARGERLEGSATELTGLSAEAPMLPAPGLGRVRLRLAYDEASGHTELRYDDPQRERLATGGQAAVLLRWPGREGRLRYLDGKGEWRDAWAGNAATAAAALPAAIALETGLDGLRLVVAVPRASVLTLPTRRELEAM